MRQHVPKCAKVYKLTAKVYQLIAKGCQKHRRICAGRLIRIRRERADHKYSCEELSRGMSTSTCPNLKVPNDPQDITRIIDGYTFQTGREVSEFYNMFHESNACEAADQLEMEVAMDDFLFARENEKSQQRILLLFSRIAASEKMENRFASFTLPF